MKPAVVLDHVTKTFRRYPAGRYTTLKDFLVRGAWLRRRIDLRIDAVKDVSLSIPEGIAFGIIGPNGAGKSTLLRLIAGIYHPDAGHIRVNGRLSALLALGLGFHPELTGRENVFVSGLASGLSRRDIRKLFDSIVEFAELGEFIDAPVRTYSSGMYMRLAFSVAVNVDPDVLLLDEVLGVGDAHFAEKSRARMLEFKKRGKTIVLVTHSLPTVVDWCQQAAWLEGGRLVMVGNPADVVTLYRQSVEQQPRAGAAGVARG